MLNNLAQRIQCLEEKFSYQEKTIDALNDVIIEQQAQINSLEEEVRKLRILLAELESGQQEIPNPPPPHY